MPVLRKVVTRVKSSNLGQHLCCILIYYRGDQTKYSIHISVYLQQISILHHFFSHFIPNQITPGVDSIGNSGVRRYILFDPVN